MTEKEARVWRALLENRTASSQWIADQCDVKEEFVQGLIDRIGSPNWRVATPRSARETLLNTARAATCGDRHASYGDPYDNLSNCAHLWEAYLNTKPGCIVRKDETDYTVRITAEDVAWLMSLLKTARSFSPGYHADNYVDATAYAAIAGECREMEEAEDE